MIPYIGALTAAWTAHNIKLKPITLSNKQKLFLVCWIGFLMGLAIGRLIMYILTFNT